MLHCCDVDELDGAVVERDVVARFAEGEVDRSLPCGEIPRNHRGVGGPVDHWIDRRNRKLVAVCEYENAVCWLCDLIAA